MAKTRLVGNVVVVQTDMKLAWCPDGVGDKADG